MSGLWGYRDSVPERAASIQALGFTERQARFLVTVMVHSGVFVERQYCRFGGSRTGRKRMTSSTGWSAADSPARSGPVRFITDACITSTTSASTLRSGRSTTVIVVVLR
jgi:hypothetical protein